MCKATGSSALQIECETVASNILLPVLLCNIPAGLANDDAELQLVVNLADSLGQNDRAAFLHICVETYEAAYHAD